jgi:hypothetical protein
MQNYKIDRDGMYSSIVLTNDKVNEGLDVYANFSDAKKELVKYLQRRRDEYRTALENVSKLKKENVK